MATYLLQNVDTDTNSSALTGKGGTVTFYIEATAFGAGTVTIESRPAGSSDAWVAVSDAGAPNAFTANTVFTAGPFSSKTKYRATLTGADGSTNDVTVWTD